MIDSHTDSDEPIHVVLEVTNREALTSILRAVDESDVRVQTRNISLATLSPETTVSIDLDILTEKQRETLELALAEGYYERPREADLTALSDHLGISKSAVSQRIRNAETKLITNALQAYR